MSVMAFTLVKCNVVSMAQRYIVDLFVYNVDFGFCVCTQFQMSSQCVC